MPTSRIERIFYFTALVKGTTRDPDNHIRQQTYIRALQTIPHLRVVLGHFLTEALDLPLVDGSGDARVLRSKEKGSDVNLATHLMWDACNDHFETAVIISGDLDFESPIRVVRDTLHKEIGVLDPQRDSGKRSRLARAATFLKPIREGVLRDSQFPNLLTDAKGKIHKPP